MGATVATILASKVDTLSLSNLDGRMIKEDLNPVSSMSIGVSYEKFNNGIYGEMLEIIN